MLTAEEASFSYCCMLMLLCGFRSVRRCPGWSGSAWDKLRMRFPPPPPMWVSGLGARTSTQGGMGRGSVWDMETWIALR